MKRYLIGVAILSVFQTYAQAREVSIGVLGLFHSTSFVVTPRVGHVLECSASGKRWTVTSPLFIRLEPSSGKIRLSGGNSASDSQPQSTIHCDDGQSGATEFAVAVPGRISRRYRGKLRVEPQSHELLVVVEIELEAAVAAIVAAESLPDTPLEALKAQAVAARSFLVAGRGRHRGFEFCDTTHCQFLREAPRVGSPATQATLETKGIVLAYQDEVFAAMYSASCGGKTHTLNELGIPVRDYPYFAVVCDYCHQHPERWVASIESQDADVLKGTESSRLKLARKLGWQTFPSNSYAAHREGDRILVQGTGKGHGIGLCQRGAAAMARQGASFQQILEHYYPNTRVKQLP